MKSGSLAALAVGAIALCGCQEALQQLNRDLAAVNQSLAANQVAAHSAAPAVMASQGTQTTQIQLIVPNDDQVKAAVDAALPTIKKILAIHQCVRVEDGMLQLNAYALPGVGMERWWWAYPNSSSFMRYHDRSKCVSIRAIDDFAMPALNALNFRTVYFAEDSGETVNLRYQMRRTEGGRWLLADTPRSIN